ncbi:hypothetical protein INR79_22715 [Vibrio sp. SCSIO 43132]|uniref:hypothetical protein n=1 Tax=Vibrio sp. SCSIO 43132 TaxID=2779363 RepID=UPI001CA99323|nr:hypothetical protein [Vibrio sp. SCSIO 43132]UAB73954.1 hypothetical protein INR79_22715 [Vibrio sp. SCSIO 43132]
MDWLIDPSLQEYCEMAQEFEPCVRQALSKVLAWVFFVYSMVGTLVSIYVIGFFMVTGITVFDGGKRRYMPMRLKVSYVLVMFYVFPIFYAAFIKDILTMSNRRKKREPEYTVVIES